MQLPQTLAHWLLAGSAAAAVIFFSAGLTSFFEYRTDRPGWVRAIHDSAMLLSLIHLAGVLLLPPRSDPFVAAGIVMYTGAIIVFLSAIEASRQVRLQRSFMDHPLPDRLVTSGPFRLVRHPFSLGYILGAGAAPVAVDNIVLAAIAALMATITVTAAIRDERAWLASPKGQEYREYKKRTGMFVPFL